MSRKDWKRPPVQMPEEGRRIKLTVSYDGSFFHGWQEQDDQMTVQETIRKAISDVLKSDVELFGSGRTDAGVHAVGQVAHFDTLSSIEPSRWALILNSRLPSSVRIVSSEEAEGVFHARFTAMAREYWYFLKSWDDMLAFDSGHFTAVRRLPDIALLNEYARVIEGTHDFTSFCSSRDLSPSKFRDIYISSWSREKDSWGRPFLKYRVVGNAFLYHQVRSMVGTMVGCAEKNESAGDFQKRLESRDRTKALKTFPPQGLYLASISYDENEYSWFEEEENGRESH